MAFNGKQTQQASQQLVALGQRRNWPVRRLGIAPMPKEPVRLGDWLIVPSHLDSSRIPTRAIQRIEAIYAAGIRPQGFVLVHEAPPQLKAGSPYGQEAGLNTERLRNWAKTGAGLLGTVAVATGTAALAIGAALLLLPALLIVGAVLVDPILIAVLDDGTWIEIDRWDV